MLNDGGNKSKIYGVSNKCKIIKTLTVKAKNNDWEDLASDEKGNLYIGDFGNNESKRKNLVILKVKHKDLSNSKKIDVEKIKFYYPNQSKFPPKKKQLFYDSESFFYYNNSLYIFTKSRVKSKFGKTTVMLMDRLQTGPISGTRLLIPGPNQDRTTFENTGPPLDKRSDPHH